MMRLKPATLLEAFAMLFLSSSSTCPGRENYFPGAEAAHPKNVSRPPHWPTRCPVLLRQFWDVSPSVKTVHVCGDAKMSLQCGLPKCLKTAKWTEVQGETPNPIVPVAMSEPPAPSGTQSPYLTVKKSSHEG